MRFLTALVVCGLILQGAVAAADLYEVRLGGPADAELLQQTGVEALLPTQGGYVVLADKDHSQQLQSSGLDIRLIRANIDRSQLAVDGRLDRRNTAHFSVLHEEGGLRLLLLDCSWEEVRSARMEVYPLPERRLPIRFTPIHEVAEIRTRALPDYDSLIALVRQDSLQSYLLRLQAFSQRLTGTDSNYAARDWIAEKFAQFGYDSVVIDPFIGRQLWQYLPCQSYNVLAYKVGTVFPDQQIILGGHFDAVPEAPGADDNGSGTAATLEIARVLADYDCPMTLIFAAWDSEESWMWGSYHYRDGAVARSDDIVLMVNPDMIGHLPNNHFANLYYGAETAYAVLWASLASTYCSINGVMAGSTASDHLPFQEAGYDVIFVQEGVFSDHYHMPSDSTTYINFEYMTRMTKATLATIYATSQVPPPVRIVAVQEPGDGQSQIVRWSSLDPTVIDHYYVYHYPVAQPSLLDSVLLPPGDSSLLIAGLIEGQAYGFYVLAYDTAGVTSYAHYDAFGTPWLHPRPPRNLTARPLYEAIRLDWRDVHYELDFSHFEIIRDGAVIGSAGDTSYVDSDPALGGDYHAYQVVAVDFDGYQSDTTGIAPVLMRAATLEPGRVLAVNRSSVLSAGLVDEAETREFLEQALQGYNYSYFSDTTNNRLQLTDLLDYEVTVIATETARLDYIGAEPTSGGILEILAYYQSIGGKTVIFGRWGYLGEQDTLDYVGLGPAADDLYHDHYHIERRIRTETQLVPPSSLQCDLVGAHSVQSGYPGLQWDSLVTVQHSAPFSIVSGIPCESFVDLTSPLAQVLYTYDSRSDNGGVEGKPVAWRYLGPEYSYVWFDIPLSFFEREPGISALQRAIGDVTSQVPCCDLRGDCNHDGGGPDISDLIYLVQYMFGGGLALACPAEGDVNGSGGLADISDLVYLVNYMFVAGPAPVPCF